MPTASEPKRRATINDVARLAGVSKGAVSRSFNRGERLPAATIARIHEAAAELGWKPSAAARAINGAPAMMVGMVVNRGSDLLALDPFFASLIAGLQRVLQSNHFAMALSFVTSEEEELEVYRRFSAENRVDGFVVADLREDDPRLALLKDLGARAVLVGDPGEAADFPATSNDADDAIRELIDGWVERGLTRIGHVSGPLDLSGARHRLDVWAERLAHHGLQADLHAIGNYRAEDSPRATQELMAVPSPPEAIFYSNDVMAIAGMRTLRAMDLDVPGDVAVAGFDGIDLASHVHPALTTIECDYLALGETAARLLTDAIGGNTRLERVIMPAVLRVGESS